MMRSSFILGAIAALGLTACSSTYDSPSPYTQRPINPLLSPAPTPAQPLARPARMTAVAGSHAVAPIAHRAMADVEPPVRVMSFNLRTPFLLDGLNHWGFRKDLAAQTIRSFEPDLLGTQECTREQAAYLLAALPNYAFAGAGRDNGTKGEMAAVFWRTDRFTKLDQGHFWLSETPERVGSKGWDAGWRRVCTWVKLQERTTGRMLVLFNTHFDVFGDTARYRSAQLIRERIATIAAGLPTVVTGDFNCVEGSAPYRTLVGDSLLTDTYRDVYPVDAPREGTRHGFDGGAGDARIDWILATPGFDTVAAQIDRTRYGSRYPSDHFPVTAVLRFNHDELAMLRSAAQTPVPANGG